MNVYRLAEKPGAPLALTEDEFAARAMVVGSVTYEQIQTAGDTSLIETFSNLPDSRHACATRFVTSMRRVNVLRSQTS